MVADKLLYCSFCGKSQHEVRKLIAGPSVFICDECIELCNDIIREEEKTKRCCFCEKSHQEVRKLIAKTIFICDQCIELCHNTLREKSSGEVASSESLRQQSEEKPSGPTNSSASGPGVFFPNPTFLRSEFGISRDQGKAFLFEGPVFEESAKALTGPEETVRFLQQMQTSGAPFDKVCVVTGPQILLVVNSKPPKALATSYSGVAEMAELTRGLVQSGAQAILDEDTGLLMIHQLFRRQAAGS